MLRKNRVYNRNKECKRHTIGNTVKKKKVMGQIKAASANKNRKIMDFEKQNRFQGINSMNKNLIKDDEDITKKGYVHSINKNYGE